MPEWAKQLQLAEVVAKASASSDRSCAVVHPGSGTEAVVFEDGSWWAVRATLNAPSADALLRLSSSQLTHALREVHMRFGPNRGRIIKVHEVRGRFEDAGAAASAALDFVRSVAAVPSTEWLWVTKSQYDERGTPPARPEPWPPDAEELE